MDRYSQLLVGFVPQTSGKNKNQLHHKLGTRIIEAFDEIDVDVVEVKLKDLDNVMMNYQASSHVAFVEKTGSYSINYEPNDRYYERPTTTSNDGLQSQWGLRRVNPEPAWDVAHRLRNRSVIAILDTGIDPTHPDLEPKIVLPVNFTSNNRNDFRDEHGHGTHVSGIAAAVTNNYIGIAGISFNTTNIMPVRVLNANGSGEIPWFIRGVIYATLNGADVISMSFGGNAFSLAFQRAIDFAWNRGVVIVASAGNNGNEQVQYPGGFNHVLCVSATNKANDRAAFSNWGINIGIAAPGTAILSTTPTYPTTQGNLRYYDAMSGTSQAIPFVSGLAAMLIAVYQQLTNVEVLRIIQRAAGPIDKDLKQWNTFFGYGLLDAANAIRRTTGRMVRRTSGRTSGNHSSSKRTSGNRFRVKRGSFYGQVVNQFGIPIANAIVSARLSGVTVSQYRTKTNVPLVNGGFGTDGMFRLPNLLPGRYDLFVQVPGQSPVRVRSGRIVGGADRILRLVV